MMTRQAITNDTVGDETFHALARTIEINLLELADRDSADIPSPLTPEGHVRKGMRCNFYYEKRTNE